MINEIIFLGDQYGNKKKQRQKKRQKRKFSTALIIDCQSSRQKIRQKFSVIKTHSSDDIKKIVNFGILIYILSCKQKNPQVFVMITENF